VACRFVLKDTAVGFERGALEIGRIGLKLLHVESIASVRMVYADGAPPVQLLQEISPASNLIRQPLWNILLY
jgi:hypothetical protein